MSVEELPIDLDRRSFVRRTAAAATGIVTAGAWGLGLGLGSGVGLNGNPRQACGGPSDRPVRVLVWCEGTARRSVYPRDIDGALGEWLARRPGVTVRTARLSDPAAGLADEALDAADVLIWWGRLRHDDVPAARAAAVVARVKAGRLGFVALHGACASQPFRALMGTACEPARWREDGQPEHVTVAAPGHPIAQGLAPFVIPMTDMFAEPFSVPAPETVVLMSKWKEGETMRSGLTWSVASGRVVYLRPGHDAFPVLFHPSIRRVIANAAVWAAART
jgi:trehalose utilization protein